MGGVQTGAVSSSYLRAVERADVIAEADVTIEIAFEEVEFAIDGVAIGGDLEFHAMIHGNGDGSSFEIGDVALIGVSQRKVTRLELPALGDRPPPGMKTELRRLCEAAIAHDSDRVRRKLREAAEEQYEGAA
jgi:hypothetical protein